jgi:hypothetical protein
METEIVLSSMQGFNLSLTLAVIAILVSFLALTLGLAALSLVIGLRNSTHATAFIPRDIDELIPGAVSSPSENPPVKSSLGGYSSQDEKLLDEMFRKIANPTEEPDDEFSSQTRIVP